MSSFLVMSNQSFRLKAVLSAQGDTSVLSKRNDNASLITHSPLRQ
jgi:hypothetical protein